MSVTVAPRRQVVDRLAEALQHRADGDGAGRTLHRLVGVVAGVEVGEDEDGGAAGDVAVGQLAAGDVRVDGGVVLDRPVDLQIGPQLARPLGRLADLVDVGAGARGSRSSSSAWRPAVRCRTGRGVGGRDRDVGELVGVRVGVDGTVAVHEHAVGRHMKKTLDTIDVPGLVLMNSRAGRIVWAVVCMAPDTMASTRPSCTIIVPK